MKDQNRVTNGPLVEQSDAYCEICKKELCNKYYLATHRRLKHTPYTIMISQDALPQGGPVDLNMLLNFGGEHNKALQNLYMSSQAMGNGSPSPSSQPSSGAASTVGNANGEIVNETPSKSPPSGSDLNNILANIMPQLGAQNMSSGISSILEQMQMNMNMFQNINPLTFQGGALLGMGGSPTKLKPKEQMKQGGANPLNFDFPASGFPFNLAPSTSTASQQSVIVSNSTEGDATPPQKRGKFDEDGDNKVMENLLSSLAAQTTCEDCGKEFEDTLKFLNHRVTEHQDVPKLPFPNPVPAQRLMLGVPPGFPFQLPINMGGQFGLDFDPAAAMAQALSTPKAPTHMKRQYSSNGKNYCDLCNKEVCNKYFLRTHMLKMHGIVIDENKTVIGNIDTLEKERQGALSFRCDICHMELKSRQLLRQHKQDQHGVVPLTTPRLPSQKPSLPSLAGIVPPSMIMSSEETKCPMCEKRVPGNQLGMHIQTEHAGDVSVFLPTPNSPTFECKLCGHVSGNENENQAHQMTVHTSEFLQQQLQKDGSKADPSVLRCNQCQYSTKDQKNMDMHSERHERMNEAKIALGQDLEEDEALQMTTEVALQMAVANKLGEHVYKCGVCNVAYPDEASLDAHATLAHNGLNLTVPKKSEDSEKIMERNSHTSGSLSPSSESLPEGFVKATQDKSHVMQSFILRISDPQGLFVGELVAQLPVKSHVSAPSKLYVEAIPQ